MRDDRVDALVTLLKRPDPVDLRDRQGRPRGSHLTQPGHPERWRQIVGLWRNHLAYRMIARDVTVELGTKEEQG